MHLQSTEDATLPFHPPFDPVAIKDMNFSSDMKDRILNYYNAATGSSFAPLVVIFDDGREKNNNKVPKTLYLSVFEPKSEFGLHLCSI